VSTTTITIAVTAAPRTLAEVVDHEALAYRAWNTPEGDFLARQMERLAQLIRFTEAETPGEFEDRLEAYEFDLRAREYDRGFEDGTIRSYCPR
jgi:hypothetical protein